MKLTRRAFAAAAMTVLIPTGCAAGSDDGSGGSDGSGASDGGSAVAGQSFPQTVTTAFGDVTIDAAPSRIVALGWGDAETALALGMQPVGASDWLGFGGEGVGPWATGLYDTPPEIIDTLEPSYEAIAALKPDLILDVKSSGDKDRYQKLSEIATTIGVPEGGENYLTTTDAQMTMISTALGMPDKGAELLDEVGSAFEAAASAHPEWKGKTVTAATKTSEGWGAYIEGGGRLDTLGEFGFVQNPTIAALPVSGSGFSVDVSSEQLDLLEADLIVAFPIYIDTTAITADPQWKRLPTVQEGHAIVIDGDLSQAFSTGTTLSTQFTIDGLVPLLEKAVPAS